MSLSNLRSLLLAVIVLSNCITWAASRHHYTHTVSGHRSRHRRQGAGLYLSGSYVLPGGEGTGWGEWGEVSPCSRTCGGGVASQKRICLKLGPDGEPQCSGGDTKYFSCQTQDCPAGSKDYRAQQCSEFDDVFFRSNIKYKWVPYTNSPFPCELNCMPHGERFYYRHRTKVVDGTRCNDESFDVCVNGTCQPVGCDMMLGSSAREDKCRECRGNGANCQTSSGILDTQDLRKGYSDLLLIPQGATTIVIEEVAPSRNYLALRANNGTYYLNGYYHIDFPRSLVIAGALWTYERNQQGFAAPDKLRCLGPTTEPLYLALLLQGTNVGVKYEYSVPNAIAPPKNKRYNWVHDEFTPCSVSCGGGIQTRNVTCRLAEELEVVDEKLCDTGMKPASNQSCSTERCPAQWTTSAWGRCSKRCGKGGVMARDVTCTQIISNGYPSYVDEKKCIERLGEKPEQFQECNVNATCPKWFTGPWRPCDKLCDQGKQKRQVVCYQKVDGRIEVFEDSECEGKKPADEQPCMLAPCLGVDWVLSEWSGCDTCLSKNRTRTAKCSTKNNVVLDKFCAHHKVPVTQEKCDVSKLPPCDVQWYATQWSKCSVDCGKGVQTRDIFCGLYDGKSVQKVNDSECADQPKYNDTKDCEVPKEKCPFKWFASGWSECTRKCDGGVQYRRTMCIRGGVITGTGPLCGTNPTPNRTQVCNTQSCDEVTENNDDACSEDELYPERGLEFSGDNSTTTMSDSPYYEANGTTIVGELESTFDTNSTTTLEFEELLPFISGNSSVATIVDSEGTTPLDDEINTTSEYDSTTDFSVTTDETYEKEIIKSTTKTTGKKHRFETTPRETDIAKTPVEKIGMSTSVELDITAAEDTTNPTTTTEISGDTSTTENSNTTVETTTNTSTINETTGDISTTKDSNTTVDMTTSGSTVSETTVDGITTKDSDTTVEITTSASTGNETTVDGITTEDSNTTVEITTSASTGNETTVDGITTKDSDTTVEITTSASTGNETTVDGITTKDSDTTVEITTSASIGKETTVDGITTEDSNTTVEITTSASTGNETTVDGITTKDSNTTVEITTSASTGNETTVDGITTEDSNTTVEITTSASTVSETTVDTITTEDSNTTVELTTSPSTVTESTGDTSTTELTTDGTAITEITEETNTTTEITNIASTITVDTNTTEDATSSISKSTERPDTNSTIDTTEKSFESTTEAVDKTTLKEKEIKTKPKFKTTPRETVMSTVSGLDTTTTEETTNATTTSETFKDISTTLEMTTSISTVTETIEDTTTTVEKTNATTVTETPKDTNTTEEITTSASTVAETTIGTNTTEDTNTTVEITTNASTDSETTIDTTVEKTNATTVTETPKDTNTTEEITTSASTVAETTIGTNTTEDTNTTVVITTSASTDSETTIDTTVEKTNATTVTETPKDTNTTEEITTSASTVAETTIGTNTTEDTNTTVVITTSASTDSETTIDTTVEKTNATTVTETPEDTNTTKEITTSASTVTESAIDTNTTEDTITTLEITTSMASSEGTESSSSTEGSTSSEGLTTWDLTSTVNYYTTKAKGIRVCKPRPCNETKFGCCPDNILPAMGTFDEGCADKNDTCKGTTYGCCPDGLSPANGPGYEGCPLEPCEETLFGCCRSDNRTAAEGNDQEGCPPPPPACLASEYGCCEDGETEPTGPGKEGCLETMTTTTTELSTSETPSETPETSSETPVSPDTSTETPVISSTSETSTSILPTQVVQSCIVSEYGCCYDNTSAATGPDQQGCPCNATEFGCCTDGTTPAHGLEYEGCCLLHAFGCCPDNIKPADGPHFEGCECRNSRFGCCPDNVTIATGPDHEGCGCQYSEYGCCPDGHTEAIAANFSGCSCHTYQFGCCPDGVTAAQGPGGHGCYCQQTTFGCCGDEQTHAKGPNKEGCDCATSKYGCCLDGTTDATGPKFQGCADKPENKQAACKLENDRGSCKNYSVSWYYDTEYGGCSRFWYGGCEGNGNRFGSKEECEDICVSPPRKDACKLPQVKGACLGYDIRWYYDNDRDSCSTFVYGGCLGNDNNFESRELCQAQCEPEHAKDECSLALERGRCGGNYSRWGYNKAARRCEEFVWGGCEGNSNRFSSEAACQLRCNPPGKPQPECSEPQDVGNCTDTKALWAFSQSENRCVPFYYMGCGGNGNKFRSREDCEEACPSAYVPELCTLPASIGECSDYTQKWYFDTQLQRCGLFYYGGCGGNDNKFNSERECESRCAITTTAAPTTLFTTTVAPSVAPAAPTAPAPQPGSQLSVPEVCALPNAVGECDNYTEKWYFDGTYQRCRPFYYGGCGGNGNKFDTERECENRCSPAALTTTVATTAAPATQPRADLSEICFMGIDEGPCNNFTERWAYDTAMGKCVSFQFGGCGGNRNNFPSDNHCSSFCRPVQDTCQLPMLAGPCNDSVMQWFYDAASDSCSQFTYGGCQGNDNRFNSREECENRCKTGPAPSSATLLTTTIKVESRTKENLLPQCVISRELEPCTRESAGEVWYYDAGTGACAAHQNQEAGVACRRAGTFYSEEACERACGGFKDIDVCGYSLEPGPCRSFVPKYFYNSTSRRCEGFAYGGCLGGANRFSTEQECQDICMATVDPCTLPPEPGNCIDRIVMWYYDARFDRCDQFAYGGCGGNENKFESQDLCEGRCRKRLELTTTTTTTTPPAPLQTTRQPTLLEECRTPTSLAPCGVDVSVYFYDEATSSCIPANFGGCRYRNSYSSEEECERQCGSFKGKDVCQASPDAGPCRGSFRKFYFDAATGNCVQFTYGGCQGGPNRFSTAEECQDVCSSSGPGRECLQAVDTGRGCGGEPGERRWHYDSTSADCLVFTYQGCGGNENNFRSYEECAVLCRVAPPPPASTLCDQYAEECIRLEKSCPYGIRASLAPEGCERCSCETPVDCGPQQWNCETLNCTYGVEKAVAENGCETCKCYEDPCIRSSCNPNERCVAAAYRDPTTKEVHYTARCEPDNITNEVLPDCEAASESCERLSCRHGKDRSRDASGCDRCWCRDNPCNLKLCAPEERCITTPFYDPVTRDLRYTARCRLVNKEGECPSEGPPAHSTEGACHSDCDDDADCRGVLKCCARGCSRACLEPAPPTPRTTTHITRAPEIPQAPQISLETKPEVVASEGGKATLRCIFHGNPPPRITWRFGEITIDGDFDRYRLLSDGALEIVSLYRNDSGVYICVASNELGTAEQQVTLQVADPVNGPAEIAGSPGATVTGELDQLLTIRCLAYGYPEPAIYWFRGRGGPMVPYSNALYEARGNELRIRRLTPKALGEYECQAYNGVDPVATWTVTVLAYQPENDYPSVNRYFVPREVVVTPRAHTTHRTTLAPQHYPEPQHPQQLPQPEPVPTYPVTEPPQAPQASSETEPEVVASEGGKATLRCIFHGNPPPRITWRFGEIMIDNDFGRYRLLSDGALEIVSLYRKDSGVYICVAANELGTAEQLITLQVAETPQAPKASLETEPQVMAAEGGKATLRCIFHGNPPPRITWRFGELTIDNNAGRYRLLSDGALEIASLYRNDSGVYICVAANELGTAQQQIMLQVADPVNGPAGITGSPGATVTGELGQPVTVQCLAYGYPEPTIYWYRGRGGEMVPYSDALYEARGNELRIRRLSPETLGEYECQAYNGVGPAVTWTVTVLAYQPENDYTSENQYYVPREVNLLAQTTHRTSLAPQHYPDSEPDPSYFVPVSTRLLPPTTTVTAGTQLSLPCEVTGNPEPEVRFTKDKAPLAPNDRIWISGARLTIERATVADSGEYGCHAANAYSSHSSTAQITVQELYIPAKCIDNPTFANCALIVQSRFCVHKYYSRFCCKSCVEAGQLNPRDAEMQADEPFRKK